jgi:hypothetical protein
MTPEQCLVEYGRAWFEREPAKRVEVLRRCCTEDIVFVDGAGRYDGLDGVSDMIGRAMANMSGKPDGTASSHAGSERGREGGGVGVEVVTPIDVQHGFFRYSFVWKLPSGERFGGTDFCELASDGRMKLITVWGANEAFPLPTS